MSASDDRGRIRTPDQRLRVSVSSTLRELEAERQAVRGALEAAEYALTGRPGGPASVAASSEGAP